MQCTHCILHLKQCHYAMPVASVRYLQYVVRALGVWQDMRSHAGKWELSLCRCFQRRVWLAHARYDTSSLKGARLQWPLERIGPSACCDCSDCRPWCHPSPELVVRAIPSTVAACWFQVSMETAGPHNPAADLAYVFTVWKWARRMRVAHSSCSALTWYRLRLRTLLRHRRLAQMLTRWDTRQRFTIRCCFHTPASYRCR